MSKHCIYVNIYYTYAYKYIYIYIHTCFQVGYTSVTLIFRLFPIYSRSPSSAGIYDESSRRIYNAAKPAQVRFEQKKWFFFGGGKLKNWTVFTPYLTIKHTEDFVSSNHPIWTAWGRWYDPSATEILRFDHAFYQRFEIQQEICVFFRKTTIFLGDFTTDADEHADLFQAAEIFWKLFGGSTVTKKNRFHIKTC